MGLKYNVSEWRDVAGEKIDTVFFASCFCAPKLKASSSKAEKPQRTKFGCDDHKLFGIATFDVGNESDF